jgi:translation initiation factor eIF-2B subunit delta
MSSTAGEAEKAVNTTTQNGSADKPVSAPKKEKAPKAEAGKTDEAAAADEDSKKISGAELKKQKQAEKAARREKEKADRMAQLGQSAATPQTPAKGAKGGDAKKGGEAAQKGGPAQGQAQHKKGQSQGGNLPMRGKPGTGGVVPMTQQQQPQRKTKEVGLFGHLYTSASKRNTMEGVSKEVHPAVLALGLQMSSFTVCGSNARCVAMLLAFKKVTILVRPMMSLFICLTRNNRPFSTIRHHTTPPLHAISHRTTSHLRSTTSNHTAPSPYPWAMPFAG